MLSPYALTKRVDEEYGRLYKELYGLDTFGLKGLGERHQVIKLFNFLTNWFDFDR